MARVAVKDVALILDAAGELELPLVRATLQHSIARSSSATGTRT
jgi:hypothetical protein